MKRLLSTLLLSSLVAMAQAWIVSVPYVVENGKMLVQVKVNGYPGLFMIDTGAPCTLTAKYAQSAGVAAGRSSQAYDSNGQMVSVRTAEIASLNLGGFNFMKLLTLVSPEGDAMAQYGVDGIIGYNLFRQGGYMKIDAKRRMLTLSSDTVGLGIDINRGICMVEDPYATLIPVRLGQQIDTVMFDTGANALYEMSNRSYQRISADTASLRTLASATGILSMGAGGVEQASLKHRVLAPSFSVGNCGFSNMSSITTDAFDSRMGSSLLHYGDVIIDYLDGFFYFQPFSSETPDVYEPEWNVVPIVVGSSIVAGMVWNDGGSGIACGDRITQIGETRIDSVDLRIATTQGLFQLNPAGTEISFINGRTGKEERMTIRME